MIGGNLLEMALGLTGTQDVEWSAFEGKTTNAAGYDVATWADPVTVAGSFQAVSSSLIQQLGLDMSRNYGTFFASKNFGDLNRDKTSDRLAYAGKIYQVISKTPWHAQDGWDYVLCVEVTNAAE